MTSRDEVEAALVELGSDDGPTVDPAFANRLDAALRTAYAHQLDDVGRRPVWVPLSAGLSALAAVIVGALIWLGAFADQPAGDVVMTAAADTDVVIPGEEVSAGAPGLLLPDGTRIVVGPNGEAVVDGVVLGPGAEAVVTDGRLAVIGQGRVNSPPVGAGPGSGDDGSAPSAAPGEPSPTSATGPGGGGGPDRDGEAGGGSASTRSGPSTTTDRPTTTATGPSSTRASDATTTTSAPSTVRSSTVPATTSTAPSSTTAPTTVTTDSAPLTIDLTATAVSRARIRLDWIVEGTVPAGELAGFRIETTLGDRTSTVVVIRSGEARSTTIERLPAGVIYRVLAVDGDGTVLQTSNPATQPDL
jgi:hypothetical protein